jgi:hypothetical protein
MMVEIGSDPFASHSGRLKAAGSFALRQALRGSPGGFEKPLAVAAGFFMDSNRFYAIRYFA